MGLFGQIRTRRISNKMRFAKEWTKIPMDLTTKLVNCMQDV